MKRIRMKTLAAGPAGIRRIDDVVVLPNDEADALIRRHNAELIEDVDTPETATVEAPEKAARVDRPKRRKRATQRQPQ